jgi:hypothetical protein
MVREAQQGVGASAGYGGQRPLEPGIEIVVASLRQERLNIGDESAAAILGNAAHDHERSGRDVRETEACADVGQQLNRDEPRSQKRLR